MTNPPSGEQYHITHNGLSATIVEVGGGLRGFTAGDWEVLDGFPIEEMCRDGRGDILIPWPNRLADGRYSFEGKDQQLPLNEVSHHNAIHGLVRWANWTVGEQGENAVAMTHRLHPSPGYPFMLDLTAHYALSDEGLQVTLRAQNTGHDACPFGAGQHPYVRIGTPLVNDASLRVPAGAVHRYNEQQIPTERISVDGTPLDFRTLRAIGATEINMDYTDLERDPDGMARVRLQAQDGGRALDVWMDGAFKHVTIYTGETVQPPSRRRQSVAVEPMTCPPNAFVSGQDLIVLQPGETWEGRWGITLFGL